MISKAPFKKYIPAEKRTNHKCTTGGMIKVSLSCKYHSGQEIGHYGYFRSPLPAPPNH